MFWFRQRGHERIIPFSFVWPCTVVELLECTYSIAKSACCIMAGLIGDLMKVAEAYDATSVTSSTNANKLTGTRVLGVPLCMYMVLVLAVVEVLE